MSRLVLWIRFLGGGKNEGEDLKKIIMKDDQFEINTGRSPPEDRGWRKQRRIEIMKLKKKNCDSSHRKIKLRMESTLSTRSLLLLALVIMVSMNEEVFSYPRAAGRDTVARTKRGVCQGECWKNFQQCSQHPRVITELDFAVCVRAKDYCTSDCVRRDEIESMLNKKEMW
eukprot:gene16038-17660_t